MQFNLLRDSHDDKRMIRHKRDQCFKRQKYSLYD